MIYVDKSSLSYLVGTWNTLLALLFLYTVVDLLHNANSLCFLRNFLESQVENEMQGRKKVQVLATEFFSI